MKRGDIGEDLILYFYKAIRQPAILKSVPPPDQKVVLTQSVNNNVRTHSTWIQEADIVAFFSSALIVLVGKK